MKNLSLILVTSTLLLSTCGTAPVAPPQAKSNTPVKLIPYNQDDLWGYRSETGETIIDPQFVMAGDFKENTAVVVDDQGWAIIDRQGRRLVRPFVYDNGPDPFVDGLARFTQNGKMGYFNPEGNIIIPAQFDFAWPFEDGRAEVCTGCAQVADGEHYTVEGGKKWTIDTAGNEVE